MPINTLTPELLQAIDAYLENHREEGPGPDTACRIWFKRVLGDFMMNHTGGWMGSGMWIWTVSVVLLVALVVVLALRQSTKKS